MNEKRAAIIILAITCVAVILQDAGVVAGDVGCGRILNCNSSVIHGQISSPRYPLPYPTDISCTWTIRSPPNTYIRLVLKNMSVRAVPSCVDHVTVQDAGPLTRQYCISWSVGSVVFHSPNNEMTIKFTAGTGNNTAHRGFFAEFSILKAACSPKQNITSFSGTITSPNYPKFYPGNLTCQWVIRLPQGYRISLTFYMVLLQKTAQCKSDYILVMDGEGSAVHIMGRFCEQKLISEREFISSGNTMTVRFRSDLVLTNKGFYAKYVSIPPHHTSPTPTMSSTPLLGKLPTQTVSSTPTQTLVVSPSKTTNVVPKQTPKILPDNLVGTYQGSYGVASEGFSYISKMKITSKIACVLKCQQTLGCKAATFSCHGDGGLCTLYDSSLQYKPAKDQRISMEMYYEQV